MVTAGIATWAAVTLLLAASVTRVFGETGFSGGAWAAWAVSTLVAALIVWTVVALVTSATGLTKYRRIGAITRAATVAAAVAGLVLGWFVPPLTDAATHVRDWLAWI
jgi:hypothetical protein